MFFRREGKISAKNLLFLEGLPRYTDLVLYQLVLTIILINVAQPLFSCNKLFRYSWDKLKVFVLQ